MACEEHSDSDCSLVDVHQPASVSWHLVIVVDRRMCRVDIERHAGVAKPCGSFRANFGSAPLIRTKRRVWWIDP